MSFIKAATVSSILKVCDLSSCLSMFAILIMKHLPWSRPLIQSEISFLSMQQLLNCYASYHFLPDKLVLLCAESSDDKAIDVFSPAVH